MSAEVAVRHFEWLFSYAPTCRSFICTDNIMPKNYPKEVFPKLTPPPDVSLFYEVKLPLSDRDLTAMTAAAVTEIQPGIEALATDTLRLMGKGTTAFLNLQFLKSCITHGIAPVWNLLMGFPGERREVYEKYVDDLPNLVHLPPPNGAFLVRFDRYSPYFAKSREYGLELRPMDFYELVYPWPAEDLAQLAYFFTDESYAPYMLHAAEWLQPVSDLVENWRRVWHTAGARPELSLRPAGPDAWSIVDSRTGTVEQYRIDRGRYRLLCHLASPVTAERLAEDLDATPEQVAHDLAFLREHQLLFEEGDRLMSLTVPTDHPSP
jgi:ribosomal peptide maturation radical SAM protein 1